jgi:hypothetical protein
MATMCISCGWVPNEASEERDVVEYAVPSGSGTRTLCTDCLEAASGAWVLKSLPHSRVVAPDAA